MPSAPSLVSIIMPAFNGEQFIAEAIKSVLAQVYPHWELIIIDDGSTDATAEIIAGFQDARIRYLLQENQGQAAALNKGLELALGDYVTTLDVDDWYTPESLESRVAILDANLEYGVAYGDGYYCDVHGKKLLRFSDQMPGGATGDVYDLLIVSPFYGTGATVLVRRELLLQHGIHYDDSIVWCQDWDFYIRLAEKIQFCYTDTISINYRLHEDGMTVAMPQGRRLESLIRTRWKVIRSPRFTAVSDDQQSAFFYDFLVRDLSGNVSEQERLILSAAFQELPKNTRSKLIRYAASNYLKQMTHVDVTKRWLFAAWKQTPLNLKSGMLATLMLLNPDYARWTLEYWQRRQKHDVVESPFALVTSKRSIQ